MIVRNQNGRTPSLPHSRNHPAHVGRLPAGWFEQLAVSTAGAGQLGHVGPVDLGVHGIGVNAAVGKRAVDDVEQVGQFVRQVGHMLRIKLIEKNGRDYGKIEV